MSTNPLLNQQPSVEHNVEQTSVTAPIFNGSHTDADIKKYKESQNLAAPVEPQENS